jgi:tripartite-type tricarboxylate transporter receptor subunit TctC
VLINFKSLSVAGGIAAAAVAVTALSASLAHADTWPSRTITYIVPFPPGSNTDVLGRLVADRLGKKLNVSVVVENKPGASGVIGATYAAGQKPDGYTIMGGSIGTNAVNASLFPHMQYDAVKSFTPITIIALNANTLVVANDSPFHSVKDIIKAAEAKPGSLSYTSSGIGSTQHLSGVLFGQEANIKLVHIPYGTKSPLPDLMGGHVSMMFEGSVIVPQVTQGNVRALAVTSTQRLASLPNVPTMREAGLPDYEIQSWQGVFAIKGTPKPIVDTLYKDIAEILKAPDVVKQLHSMGVEPSGITPAEFAAFQKKEIDKWHQVITAAHITVE